MKINKKKGFNIKLILDGLSEKRTIGPSGSFSMLGMDSLDDSESYLMTAIEIEGKTDAFVRNVVKEAMHVEQNMTEQIFIDSCKRIAHIKEKNSQNLYKVIFPLWGSTGLISGRRRWGNVSISFDINQESNFARRAIKDRETQVDNRRDSSSISKIVLQSLPLAVCSVKGINVRDAFEQAEIAISKELGIYSVISSRGKYIFTNEAEKPINTILLAPHMTVHNKDGSISSDIYWHTRWPKSFIMKKRPKEEIDKISKSVENIRKRLRILPWRAEAEMALFRHYSAFSQADLESSFLDGWRLLEAIGGHRTEKSETLVKRASWFFENRDEQYQFGLHLLERRNLISHGRPVRDESNEGLAFQMKQFLTPLLHTFITNPFNFESIDELWNFCDLPVDKKRRLRTAYLINCSSKFRREV